MDSIGFLLSAFLGGLLVFIPEELFQSARYSLPTILICFLLGLLMLNLARRKMPVLLAWILTATFIAAVVAALRVGLVYGGFVSFLARVDCFAMRGFTTTTYFLFALSGAIAGAVISRFDRGQPGVGPVGILGVILGVLYHMHVSQGWWSGRLGVQQVLFLGEFLAPLIAAMLLLLLSGRLRMRQEP